MSQPLDLDELDRIRFRAENTPSWPAQSRADTLAAVTEVERLRAETEQIHTPVEEECEVWHEDVAECPTPVPTPNSARTEFAGLLECPGHDEKMQVCSECGYTHDGEYPKFRQWPCPTIRAVSHTEETPQP